LLRPVPGVAAASGRRRAIEHTAASHRRQTDLLEFFIKWSLVILGQIILAVLGGADVVGVPVEVPTGFVVAHRGLRVGVPGGDLHVAETGSRIQHGRNEGVPQHVRVHSRQPDPRILGQIHEPAGGGVPVHPPIGGAAQDRPLLAPVGGVLDRAGHRWRQGDQDGLAALAADLQHTMAVLLAEVGDVRAAGFEDPRTEQAQHRDQGEVVAVGR
jgi:hypothetical protein